MLCGAHCKPYTGASAAVNQEFIGLVRERQGAVLMQGISRPRENGVRN